MNIQEILNHSSNVSFTVTGNDLLLFADHLIKLSLAAAEKSNAHKKSVAYLTPNEVCKQLKVARSTLDRKSTRLTSSHIQNSRRPSFA